MKGVANTLSGRAWQITPALAIVVALGGLALSVRLGEYATQALGLTWYALRPESLLSWALYRELGALGIVALTVSGFAVRKIFGQLSPRWAYACTE